MFPRVGDLALTRRHEGSSTVRYHWPASSRKEAFLLPLSHLLSNRSSLLHIRLVVPEVRNIPPHHATNTVASVELVGMRPRTPHTQCPPTPVVQREGSLPTQPWKGGS